MPGMTPKQKYLKMKRVLDERRRIEAEAGSIDVDLEFRQLVRERYEAFKDAFYDEIRGKFGNTVQHSFFWGNNSMPLNSPEDANDVLDVIDQVGLDVYFNEYKKWMSPQVTAEICRLKDEVRRLKAGRDEAMSELALLKGGRR